MKHIRTLIIVLVWTILKEYQLLMLPMEFIVDGCECEHPHVGPIKVTIEQVRECNTKIAFDRDDILVGVDALEKK